MRLQDLAVWLGWFATALPWAALAVVWMVLMGRERFIGWRLASGGVACAAGSAGVWLALRFAEARQADAVIWAAAAATAAVVVALIYDIPEFGPWPARRRLAAQQAVQTEAPPLNQNAAQLFGPFLKGQTVEVDGYGQGKVVGGQYALASHAWWIYVLLPTGEEVEVAQGMVHALKPQPDQAAPPTEPAGAHWAKGAGSAVAASQVQAFREGGSW